MKAVQRSLENVAKEKKKIGRNQNSKQQSLVFSLQYSRDNSKLKKLVREMEPDIKRLCGELRIIFAERKHPSIGNVIIKNRQLGEMLVSNSEKSSQMCGSSGCKTCPLLFKFNEKIIVNGVEMYLDKSLTCIDKYVIYVAQCQICNKLVGAEDTYIGQTLTPLHIR
ncbi:MAG: hypothetical protein GY816_05355, partial [Cytophagales bacterium]|nr:hypothetical protein [Cytophagales bacterium]